MATIRKRVTGGTTKYFVEVCVKGVRRGKTFATKQLAQAWALETEQLLGREGAPVHGKTLGDALSRYKKEVTPTKPGHRSEGHRLEKLMRADIAAITLLRLTTEDLQRWLDSQPHLSSASVNRDFTILCGVLKTAKVKWRWMNHSPQTETRRPKDPAPRDRRISDDESKRILSALEYKGKVETTRHQIAIAFLFAIETAMRQGEIWGLEWDRISLSRRFLSLDKTKNGTRRDVPLSKKAVEFLNKMSPKEHGRVFTGCAQSVMEVIFRRTVILAGIHDLHFHDTRHEGITRLARKLDLLDLARMVGHKDPRSLMIYYNATAEEIAARLE